MQLSNWLDTNCGVFYQSICVKHTSLLWDDRDRGRSMESGGGATYNRERRVEGRP